MKKYLSDRTMKPVPFDEVTILRIASGPLGSMIGRKELHFDKPEALAIAKWLGFDLARPELETIPGPDGVTAGLDLDATERDLRDALVVKPSRARKGRPSPENR